MNINKILTLPNMRELLIKRLIRGKGFCKMRGDVNLVVRDGKTGEIRGKRQVCNLVVTVGLAHIADQLADTPAQAEMSYAGIGSDNTAPATGQTALLAAQGARQSLTSKVQSSNTVTYTATIPAGIGTHATIREAGLFNASSGVTMMARTTFAAIAKGAGDAIDISWTLTISAA